MGQYDLASALGRMRPKDGARVEEPEQSRKRECLSRHQFLERAVGCDVEEGDIKGHETEEKARGAQHERGFA